MSLDSRLRALEEKTPAQACAKCGQLPGPQSFEIGKRWPDHPRMVPTEKCSECGRVLLFSMVVGPEDPHYDEVMLTLIGCGAVVMAPRQDAQDAPSSA